MVTHQRQMPIDELRLARRAGILNLRGQGLSQLPFKVQDVHGLRHLFLGGNEFKRFPSELAKLKSLTILELDDNLLEELPEEIGLFQNLQELNLRGNQLKSLPSQLGPLLRRGVRIILDANPVLDLYPELLHSSSSSLAAYIESLGDGVPQYEAKMILVGEGNVGKTSIVASLLEEPFVTNRPTTHGIEINSLRVPHPGLNNRSITLRTWDFGGQEVYRITHQFFFSQRALYLVVWNPREGQEQNEVEGWLRRIRLRTGSDATSLIVATHCAERTPEIDYPRLRGTFADFLVGQYSVDNHSRDGIAPLRHAIAREASRLPQMGLILSERWAAAREELLRRSYLEPEISFTELESICERVGVSNQEVPALASLLHDLGQIVYYGDDEGLKDIVVLNPEWLTKAIGFVLEDKAIRINNGVLDHRRLPDIWTDGPDGNTYPAKYYPYFLRLMEKFDVSYRIDGEEHRSLVAQLVQHDRPHLRWRRDSPVRAGDRAVRLICRLSEAAPGLIAWLTVRHHRASTKKHWRHGVFLKHPIAAYDSEALLELRADNELLLEVRAPSPDLFFNVLRDSIEELITRRWPGLTYELLVPCPTDENGGCRGSFPLEGLIKLRERGKLQFDCLDCNKEHDVAELLTGFRVPAQLVSLESVQGTLAEIADDVKAIGAFATESADVQRRTLKAVAAEVTDCPRLFTLREQTSALTRLSFWKRAYSLRLWCEHPSAWHPSKAADYKFARKRDWVNQIAPYARLSFKALRLVVPIAAATLGVIMPASAGESVKDELELMKTLIDKTPAGAPGAEFGSGQWQQSLSPAEGEALRNFRYLLFTIDPPQSFGGLRRVQAPSGEFIWVCPEHYAEYDPGLPILPLQ